MGDRQNEEGTDGHGSAQDFPAVIHCNFLSFHREPRLGHSLPTTKAKGGKENIQCSLVHVSPPRVSRASFTIYFIELDEPSFFSISALFSSASKSRRKR
jgi:hypothetical protein